MANAAETFAKATYRTLFNQSGEVIIFTSPSTTVGRNIYAFVDRRPPQRWDSNNQLYQPDAEFEVENDAQYGISSTELIHGGTIAYAKNVGDTVNTVIAVRRNSIVAQDAATIRITTVP